MTIKEAFTLLANKIGSGMKNPFFIVRNLHDAFAEIAEKIEGGGGPTTVDAYDVTYKTSNVGEALDSVNSYSNTERVIGKWIDGVTDVYERTFYVTNLQITDNLYYVIDSSFTSSVIDLLIESCGGVKSSNGTGFVDINGLSINTWDFGLHINANGLLLYGNASSILGGTAVIKLRYTKKSV